VVQGQSSGKGSGEEVSQKLKLFAHLHIIFLHHTAKNWGCQDTVDTNGLTPLLGVWRLFPGRSPEAEPLFRGSGAKLPRSSKLFAAQVADLPNTKVFWRI